MPTLLLLAAASLAAAASGTASSGAIGTQPSAAIVAAPALVYDFYREHCPPLPQRGCALSISRGCDCDIADAPLRLWRDAAGGLRALASVDLGSRGFAAPGPAGRLADLVHTCALYANSTRNESFADYASHEWIHSSWRDEQDDRRLVALTHMEYHCDEPTCPYYGTPLADADSWLTAVTLMASEDGGASWAHARPAPAHVVAVPPFVWNETLGAAGITFGFRSPSNILKARDGYYYATVTAGWGTSMLGQQAGACMLRTRDVTDPASWRAWGGAAFDVDLSVSPYAHPSLDPAQHICVPFTNSTYMTLAWSTLYNAYLLFGTTGGDDGAGWSFALSDDLIAWRDWTPVDTSGYIAPAGDGKLTPSGAPFTGRFVQPVGGGSQVWWEDAARTIKRPVGSCKPCPGIDACSNITHIPAAEWAALTNASQYGCSWQYNASGTAAYYYPTIVDDTQGVPNFDVVGDSATLLLVASMCVSAEASADGGVRCSPFDENGLLVRNVVRLPVNFAAN